jgi:hypothetical protein
MAVKGADTDSRRPRDSFKTRFRSASAEHASCGLEQKVAVPKRVGAWLSRSFFVQRLLIQRFFVRRFLSNGLLEKRRIPPYLTRWQR